MIKWLKRKSLLFTSSIVLSLLFLIVIGVMVAVLYTAQKEDLFRQFRQVGDKLQAQGQVNIDLIASAANAVNAGEEPPSGAMSTLRKLLDGMTDKESLTNAYYLSAVTETKDNRIVMRNLQVNASLEASGSGAGMEFVPPDILLDAFGRALRGEPYLTPAYEDEYGEWITYAAPVLDDQGQTVAMFGIDYDYDSVHDQIIAMLWKAVAIGIIAALAAIALVFYLVRQIVRSLRLLAVTANEAAQGNLTVAVPVTTGNEIGQASASFNTMIGNLRELALRVQRNSGEVTVSSRDLKETAQQTAQATNEIASAIQNVASGTETQLGSSQECQRAMTEMAVGIQRIAESSSVVSDLATHTAKQAAEGASVVERTALQMQTIESHVFGAAGSMRELSEYSGRIGDILSHIAEVANQTNLLALNASIEAARAGEHGQGFSVVAVEIRKLAERSKESSEEIAEILHTIGARSEEVAASLALSVEEAREGTRLANSTGDTLRLILSSFKEVSEQVQEVSAASEQMSAGSEEIAASLDELERIAQSSSAHAQQVAAASEEQLASMEDVANASERLRALSIELDEAVGRFKV
ncbi:methyl-accepting chemotaxis protein [Cohnella cellulosilytica]|uniref:Methyl-accepting chemotaxis protein n=1 Tax=Cohnella cellulosilytica TaxID=986710 RepID=A0ABW2FFE9_9BACL